MPHTLEPASSGRSRCRGCGRPIPRGELRLGERLPNPFGEGEMTLWFHPACAAFKRPEPLLAALAAHTEGLAGGEALERAAQQSLEHRRLPRIDGAERAKSGQARCRQCHEPILRGSWRIRLVFYEEGQFAAGGFVHLACRTAYFGTGDILARLLRFSPELTDAERDELKRALDVV